MEGASVSSRLFLLAPGSLYCERTLSTNQKGTCKSRLPQNFDSGTHFVHLDGARQYGKKFSCLRIERI